MNIRKEEVKNYNEVFELIENVFKKEQYTDHKERFDLYPLLRKATNHCTTF